jgi:hypothetical protein
MDSVLASSAVDRGSNPDLVQLKQREIIEQFTSCLLGVVQRHFQLSWRSVLLVEETGEKNRLCRKSLTNCIT